jgi:glycosyltransferase involved in cell wall biosynthesis
MRRVVIVQSFLKSFRVPFYRLLLEQLRQKDVEMDLIFGQPDRFHRNDADIVQELPFAHHVRNIYVHVGGRTLVWEPVLGRLSGANLVVAQQGNRHLLNHLLLCARKVIGCRLALWGHGRNFQARRPDGLLEGIKRASSRHVDHWFAYTDRSRSVLLGLGVPDWRITTVQNALDTRSMSADYHNICAEEVDEMRRTLGIEPNASVAISCGRFYHLKAVDFLLDCAVRLRAAHAGFHLLLVGDGQEAEKVSEFCRRNPHWAHYLGPRYDRSKALCFRLACCQLMPGAVGLSVVDSFAFEAPLITRDLPCHGPEIEYLEDGVNGIVTRNGMDDYTASVLRFLDDSDLQQRLRTGCRESCRKYTIENMASRFASGVMRALATGNGD